MTDKNSSEKPDIVSKAPDKAEETASDVRNQTASTLENKDPEHLISSAKEYIENRCGYWQFAEDTDSLIGNAYKETIEWGERSEGILNDYSEAVRQVHEIDSIDNQELPPEMKEALSAMISKIDPKLMDRLRELYDEIYEAAQELMENAFNPILGIRYLLRENPKGKFKPCAAHPDLMSLLEKFNRTKVENSIFEQKFPEYKEISTMESQKYAAYQSKVKEGYDFGRFTSDFSVWSLHLQDLYKCMKDDLRASKTPEKSSELFLKIIKTHLSLMFEAIAGQRKNPISDFTDAEGIRYVQETEAERAEIFMNTFLMCMIALRMLREQRKWMIED